MTPWMRCLQDFSTTFRLGSFSFCPGFPHERCALTAPDDADDAPATPRIPSPASRPWQFG